MTIVDMLGQSLTLTLLGMAVVFSFLIIMIIFMKLIEKLVKALKLDKDKPDAAAAPVQQAAQDNAVIAAIAAALKEKQN